MKNQKNRLNNFTKSGELTKTHQPNKKIATHNITKILTALVVILALLFPAVDSLATRWSDNLVILNPGAETHDTRDWNTTPGSCSFKSSNEASFSGQWSFKSTHDDYDHCKQSMYQDFDLTAYSESIDTGTMQVKAKCYLNITKPWPGETNVYIRYEDMTGKFQALSCQWPDDTSGWKRFDLHPNIIPKGTRKVRLQFTSMATSYWDEFRLYISLPKFDICSIGLLSRSSIPTR